VNNAASESTKCTPILAVQAVDPRMSLVGEPTQDRDQRCLDADQAQATMQQVHEHLCIEMRRSQVIQEERANRGRIPAPHIQIGSKVWLYVCNIRTTRPTGKVDWKRVGLFKVTKQVSPYAYELEFPASI
jgi:hypothetical protein